MSFSFPKIQFQKHVAVWEIENKIDIDVTKKLDLFKDIDINVSVDIDRFQGVGAHADLKLTTEGFFAHQVKDLSIASLSEFGSSIAQIELNTVSLLGEHSFQGLASATGTTVDLFGHTVKYTPTFAEVDIVVIQKPGLLDIVADSVSIVGPNLESVF